MCIFTEEGGRKGTWRKRAKGYELSTVSVLRSALGSITPMTLNDNSVRQSSSPFCTIRNRHREIKYLPAKYSPLFRDRAGSQSYICFKSLISGTQHTPCFQYQEHTFHFPFFSLSSIAVTQRKRELSCQTTYWMKILQC